MNRRGFTLLEIICALALTALVLVALNTFIFSMGELWGRHTDDRLFYEHVAAVSRYLGETFEEATYPPAARANATPVAPVKITPENGPTDNLLTFDLLSGSRVLSWPDRPLPEVTCSLQFRPGEGLYLLWHSRLETNYATDAPRELLLTPLVTGMAYDYFDTTFKRWTKETAIKNDQNNQPEAPGRLRLTFAYGKLTREVTIPIPAANQGMPNF